MIRSFLAIDPPAATTAELADAVRRWSALQENRISWVRGPNFHLTLKFFGDVPESRIEEIRVITARVASDHIPFRLKPKGTGVFPDPKRPRVLWVGLAGETHALFRLQETLDLALQISGFQREGRNFSPHLTVGRVRSHHFPGTLVDDFLRKGFNAPPFTVEEVILYRSDLAPGGPIYTALARCPLGHKGD